MYPLTYVGKLSCWDNALNTNEIALSTVDVILTSKYLIQITDEYQIGFQEFYQHYPKFEYETVFERDCKKENLIWRCLFHVLPAIETALLKKCYRGHLEIVMRESKGMSVRCIRETSEANEVDMTLTESLLEIIKTLVGDFETMTVRGHSNLSYNVLHYLKITKNQLKAISVIWQIVLIAHEYVKINTLERNWNANVDTLIIPSIAEIEATLGVVHLTEDVETVTTQEINETPPPINILTQSVEERFCCI